MAGINSSSHASPFLRGSMILGLCCIWLTGAVVAEDFEWSWEDDKAQKELDPGQEFNWEWSGGETSKTDGATSPRSRRPDRDTAEPAGREAEATPAVDPAAYNDVMRENIELRKQVAEKERLAENAAKRSAILEKEQTTLQAQINTLASTIESLESQRSAAADDSKNVKELEVKLAQAENEKARLSLQLSELATTVDELKEEGTAVEQVEQPEPEVMSMEPAATVQPGSDLFRQMQEENALLKEKLAEIENVRAQAAKQDDRAEQLVERSKTKEQKLKSQLKAAKETQEEQQEVISGLLRRMPRMEEELEELRARAGGEESVLAVRERELENVREEVRRREYRLIKAERMAAMMSEAREEVQGVTDEQARNMHYNMAVVYAKEGRFKEAEAEYLRAMRIDPSDAAAHYNLAILYDDELKNKNRAVMHYKKYLQLAPDAPDRNEVKQWILRLEVQ